MLIKIKNEELIKELIGEVKDFPLYTTQLIYEINKDFLPIIEEKIGKNKPSLFDQKDIIEVICQNNKKESNNHLVKIGENNKTINNRIRHPEYWKTLKNGSF